MGIPSPEFGAGETATPRVDTPQEIHLITNMGHLTVCFAADGAIAPVTPESPLARRIGVRRNRGGSMVAVVRGFVYVGVSGLYVVIGEGQDGASPPFRRRAAI